jgi:hypothetical protein
MRKYIAKSNRKYLFKPKNTKEFEKMSQEYFDECVEKEKNVTITGLALALGTTRKGLLEMADSSKFGLAVKQALTVCENVAETILLKGGNATAGAIFSLKQHGWQDKAELDISSKGEQIQFYLPKRKE